MAIPETIKQFRPTGTEIQEHSGHYYVYKVKAVYDPLTKKSKRKSEGCIGQIYEGIGFVSNSKKRDSSQNIVKEYGATAFLCAQSLDVRDALVRIFGKDGLRIYVLAILKLLTNTTHKNMDIAYERSYISAMLPEVHISKNTLSDFLEKLGLKRYEIVEFLKEFGPKAGSNIVFDGSSFCSGSTRNPYVNYGYNPNKPDASQIRLIYGFNIDSNLPIYFNVIPGNITDKMAFVGCLKESGFKNCSVILDNDFFSRSDLKYMSEEGLSFVMPLTTNLKVVKNFDLGRLDKEHMHFLYHKRVIKCCLVTDEYLDGYSVYAYFDQDRRRELLGNYYRRNNIKESFLTEKQQQQIDEDTKYFGVTFLVSNGIEGLWKPELIFRQYKKRWNIEEMFDTHKNTLGFTMKYEASGSSQNGWAFIEFLSLLIYMKTETSLTNNSLTKGLSVSDALLRFAAVVKCKINGTWEIWNLDSKTKKLLDSLSVDLS